MNITTAGAIDRPAIESLLDDTFGTDRHGRTAYKLRAGVSTIRELSLVAKDESGKLLGSIQCWPLSLDGMPGLTLLGPVAVRPELQGQGIGIALMQACLRRADKAGYGAVVLIGDPEYYERFGFTAEATAEWQVPGPVEQRRLLARLAPGVSVPAAGMLGPSEPRRLAA